MNFSLCVNYAETVMYEISVSSNDSEMFTTLVT